MGRRKHWIVGIDPGFTENGMVLLEHSKTGPDVSRNIVRGYATFTCRPDGSLDVTRAAGLGSRVVELVRDWIDTHKIRCLYVGIETPVYKKNPATFTKQVRLLQEIESGLVFTTAGDVKELYLAEINPTRSKKHATGDGSASKDMMVAASPFAGFADSLPRPTLEALADAYAHALATTVAEKVAKISLSDEWDRAVKELCTGEDLIEEDR